MADLPAVLLTRHAPCSHLQIPQIVQVAPAKYFDSPPHDFKKQVRATLNEIPEMVTKLNLVNKHRCLVEGQEFLRLIINISKQT
jgi:hypothetical protein